MKKLLVFALLLVFVGATLFLVPEAGAKKGHHHFGDKFSPVARLAHSGDIQGTLICQQAEGDPTEPPSLLGTLVFIPGTSFMAIANANGEFTISNVPAGTYELAAAVSGLDPVVVQEEVKVRPKRVNELEPIQIACAAP